MFGFEDRKQKRYWWHGTIIKEGKIKMFYFEEEDDKRGR